MTRLVVTNTNYLDVHSLEFKNGRTIVMENGKFTWIGDEGSFETEEGDHLVQGDGKYVIPGLMDLHVHLNYEQEDLQYRGKDILRRKEEYADYLALKHAQQYLKIGVTTVRGCGGRNSLASLRQVIDEGKIVGPRLKLALKTLVQPGNQEYFGTQVMIDDQQSEDVISGKDGVMHAVRKSRANGADHIKTTTTGGVVHGKTSDINQVLWTDEELDAMVTEAERLGMYVAAHCHATPGIKAAIRAGVRTLEHGTILDDEAVDMILERGTFVTPTLSAGTYIYHMPDDFRRGLPPEVVSKWENVSAKMIDSHKLGYERGVKMTVGTDGPVAGPHAHTNDEMALMVKNIGMKPLEVIRSGTIVSAEAIKMDKQLGSIEVGKLGDLVILDKDPSQDISVLQDLSSHNSVIKEGKIVSAQGKLLNI